MIDFGSELGSFDIAVVLFCTTIGPLKGLQSKFVIADSAESLRCDLLGD
jgi:hypothetical protein